MKPIYHEKISGFRIAYVANDRWQLQANFGKGTRERDNWLPQARPTDLATAKAQLKERAR